MRSLRHPHISIAVSKASRKIGGIGDIFHHHTTYSPSNWVIICYLPPIEGTRKLHWMYFFLIHNLDRTRIRGTFFAVSTSRPLWPLCHKTRRGLTATRFQLKNDFAAFSWICFLWWCCYGFDHAKSPLNSTSIWGNICFHVFFQRKIEFEKIPVFQFGERSED